MDEKKVIIDIPIYSIVRVITALAIVGVLFLLKDVVLLVILSFIFATAVKPFVDFLQKKRIPRVISILIIFSIISFIIYIIIKALVPPVINQIGQIIENQDYYIEIIRSYFNKIPFIKDTKSSDLLNQLISGTEHIISGGTLGNVLGVFSGFLGFITMLILSFYFLLEKRKLEDVIPHYFSEEHSKRLARVYKDISRKMTYWFWGQISAALIVGLLVFIGLSILGIKYALVLSIIAFITEIIPTIGPLIAGSIAIGVALTMSPVKALSVLILYALVQIAENNFILPLIMKKALGVSPAIIIIALLVGGTLFGFIGIIIALPLAVFFSVIIDELYKRKLEEGK